jgi:porin
MASMKIVIAALALSIAPTYGQESVSSARTGASEERDRNPLNAFKERGITFPVSLTTEILGNIAGGSERAAIWESLFKVGLKIDFEKAATVKGLSLNINALYPQGAGLTQEAVHDFNTLSNIDAYDSVRLYEAWLQEEVADGKFSVRIGQLSTEADFFASDYGALFLNSAFGAIPLASRNLNAPIYPIASPGIRLRLAPSKSFYVQTVVFSGNVGDPSTTNKHNTNFSLPGQNGILVFAEMGYKLNPKEKVPAVPVAPDEPPNPDGPPPPPKPPKLSGTYKLGGYYDSTTFKDSGGSAPHNGDYSIYLVADQELWHPNGDGERGLSFFARLGAAPDDQNPVVFYADAGLNYKGLLVTREKDTLGVGFNYTDLSNDLLDESGHIVRTHYEATLEFTYQATVGDHISIQPDLQCIFNPGAVKPASTAIAGGVRVNIKY